MLLLSFSVITAYTAVRSPSNPTADAIVVLGAGMSGDGTLGHASVERVMKGVALYNNKAAPRIHFTGGPARPGGPSAGNQMAALAREMGIPDAVITTENRSYSTLQNALFSKPMLEDSRSVILVSEAFHLPRSKASFWWMGYDDVQVAHSARFRRTSTGQISLRMLGRETLAVWFNFGRAGLWSVTGQKQHDWLK